MPGETRLPSTPLPACQLADAELAALRAPYEKLIGFAPPRIVARTELGAGDAARLHAIAARRAGASWEELHAVVGLAYLFRGMPAANLGAEILLKLAETEGAPAPPGSRS